MFCNNCGAQMLDGTRFCQNCGADNSSSLDGFQAQPAPAQPAPAAPHKVESPSSGIIALVFTGMLPPIGFLMGLIGWITCKAKYNKIMCRIAFFLSLIICALFAWVIWVSAISSR